MNKGHKQKTHSRQNTTCRQFVQKKISGCKKIAKVNVK